MNYDHAERTAHMAARSISECKAPLDKTREVTMGGWPMTVFPDVRTAAHLVAGELLAIGDECDPKSRERIRAIADALDAFWTSKE